MESTNPYESPKSNTFTASDETYQPKLFAWNGRIGRLRYFAYATVASFVTMFVLGILAALLVPGLSPTLNSEGMIDSASMGIILIMYIPLILISVVLMKRRLNDLDKSGWWQLLYIVPIANIFFALYTLLWPGTKGSNSYGLQPAKNSTLLVIAGVILPIFIVGILAAIAIPAYQEYSVRAQQALELN